RRLRNRAYPPDLGTTHTSAKGLSPSPGQCSGAFPLLFREYDDVFNAYQCVTRRWAYPAWPLAEPPAHAPSAFSKFLYASSRSSTTCTTRWPCPCSRTPASSCSMQPGLAVAITCAPVMLTLCIFLSSTAIAISFSTTL